MSTLISQAVTPFSEPDTSLAGLDVNATARAIATASDISLIVDADGVVRDVAFGGGATGDGFEAWVGQPWADTVTPESQNKIEALLHDARQQAAPRWRQVNHPTARGEQAPVIYAAIPLGADGRVLAIGRDMRAVASLQRRLVDAQRAMERDYGRLRQAETRYRVLFQLSTEAVMIVDEGSGKVVEANPAALDALDPASRKPIGRSFLDLFEPADRPALQDALTMVRGTGRADAVWAKLRDGAGDVSVTASHVRSDDGGLFLVRLTVNETESVPAETARRAATFASIVEAAPEALLVTDLGGTILKANAAFLDLVELNSEEQARGQPLDRWLGRPGVDAAVVLGNLREHGSLRLFSTTVRGETGAVAEVELSAVSVPHGDPPCHGLMLRNVEARLRTALTDAPALPKSVEQLTELVGRVPMKDIVRETTDVIERLCIEAALKLTSDNRASAAEMLGLSRQSLYVKLRRYGLGDLDGDSDG